MEFTTLIKCKKLHDDVKLPKYATIGSSGSDIRSYETTTLEPNERKLISTGLCFEIPKGYEMQVRPRSGLAIKQGITILNTPGTIDSDYRGEIKIIMINHSNETKEIMKGDRIAQLIVQKVERAIFVEDDFTETERGEGAFGHTGHN
jgi:dUTP pyrophosphatase